MALMKTEKARRELTRFIERLPEEEKTNPLVQVFGKFESPTDLLREVEQETPMGRFIITRGVKKVVR